MGDKCGEDGEHDGKSDGRDTERARVRLRREPAVKGNGRRFLGWSAGWSATTLDVVGLVPGFGEIADGTNALISLGRGDFVGAGLSAAAMIPFAGWGATVGKVGRKVVGKAGKEAVEEAAEQATKHVDDVGKHADEAVGPTGKQGDGAKGIQVKPTKMKQHEIPCFKKGKGEKGKEATDEEYDQQLRDQEEALNNMSVEDFQKARNAYEHAGRHPDAATETVNFRREFQAEQTEKLTREMRAGGMAPDIAKQQAAKQAENMMKGLDALHIPDQSAGGALNPKPTKMGSPSANRSIGGQWKQNNRIQGLDKAVANAVKEHGKGAKLNVKLKRCQ